ncbi:response regulator [Empedobacter stercoris]|uniref:response regulator n=1 Tax=Empedobacter TaxID=59734 RepID=UPI001D7E457D|nr:MULTISPECIES: response regulator [Empedobacter]MDM1524142.1 response regulator transcription factor [Empedobacter sp. 225-1]MDM1543037.1 response regulator transcription factor [Empedobacter sp. 189-2]UWX67879.1 response regulator [Empedobacter stercoris]HJD87667.1 response regulator [Empedobacter falsenii]
MFKKVLIAEDFESFNISIQKVLKDLNVDNPDYAFYCDDAFLKIKKALHNEQPYDLLISDLSFEEDHREQTLKGGKDLIEAVKAIQPHLKIIVFSVEKKADMVDNLFKEYDIDGFVAKGREDSKELKKAIQAVFEGEKHLELGMKRSIKQKNTFEITSYDVTLVSLLSKGVLLKDIPNFLVDRNIKPSSKSSVEKRLGSLKESLQLTSNHQLVAFFKDLGSI